MKPMNPPRRRVVRRRMLGGSGSAMSAKALQWASHRKNLVHTPQVQGRWKCAGCCGPSCIVGRTEITDDTREMGVRVDERVGRLHDLVRHGAVLVSVENNGKSSIAKSGPKLRCSLVDRCSRILSLHFIPAYVLAAPAARPVEPNVIYCLQ